MLFLLLLAACTNDPDRHDPKPDTSDDTDSDVPADSADTSDTELPVVDGCRATPAEADRDRVVVASLPYGDGGRPSSNWAAIQLSTDGELSDTGNTFEMGRALYGDVVFTPDGEIGFAVQEDGSVGVFRIDEGGSVTVVHAAFSGDFYASRVVIEPSGEVAWIVDGNWAENGGGLFRASIDCGTGELGVPDKVLSSKLGYDLLPLRSRTDRAVYVARELTDEARGDDAWLLDWSESPSPLSWTDAFGDDEAIISDGALTFDDRYALLADNSFFSGIPNRVAVVAVGEDALTATQIVDGFEDPVALVPSPHGDVVLVVSGYGNAIYILDYAPDDAAPFTLRGEMDYDGGSPQLPGSAALLARGALSGLTLVAEVEGIRAVQMTGDGVVEDLGLFSLGGGYTGMAGVVGVQP